MLPAAGFLPGKRHAARIPAVNVPIAVLDPANLIPDMVILWPCAKAATGQMAARRDCAIIELEFIQLELPRDVTSEDLL
jgi:hypothetical protein